MKDTIELKIRNKIDSMVGFALESKGADVGGSIKLLKTGSYLSKEDSNSDFDKVLREGIRNIMLDMIFPLYLHHFCSNSKKNQLLNSVRIEMFSDKSKNIISFGKDAKIHGFMKLIKKRKMKEGEIILDKDIEKYQSIFIKDRDPNSAIMLLVLLRGEWYGVVDLTYNREISSKKYEESQQFISATITNFDRKLFTPFYDSLWAAYELLIESITLLSQSTREKDNHTKIANAFKIVCENYNFPYSDDYELIKKIRFEKRYARDVKDNVKLLARSHLRSLLSFADDTEKLLKQLNPSNTSNSVDVSNLQSFETI